ncbi:MAG: dual specificity protein phosphatase family protein [Candidatus Sericytochromatia bacterium]|nr:dual specificity protein phosphatase family protein [Candidatus Sericytochromatia bacterium]
MAYRFTWIVPNLLAGMACPGYFTALDADLDHLAGEGVRHIVTLTEFPLEVPPGSAFDTHHVPVADMGAPVVDQVAQFCVLVDGAERARQAVAVHCLAGIGRTGTFLAGYLMWREGLTARQALTRVRSHRKEYVQSVEQEGFLEVWEAWLAHHGTR